MAQINNVTINGNQVNFKYGITLKDILNQDLNTGSLVIPNSDELDIEPFDLVVITYETIKQIKLYVGTVSSKITKFSGVKKYNYDIGLVSLSTKLQRIILPNKSITQSLDGTQDKTIKTIMLEYLELYAPSLTLSTQLIQKLGLTIAPEQQWNRPTLFEVFNDLLKPLGSVVTMSDVNIISYLDLDEQGNQIDEDFINNYEITHDLREYSSAIEIDAQNVYSRTSISKTPESYVAKTIEQGLLTTRNHQIVLNKPIFEIKKVMVTFPYIDTNNIWQKYTLDITNRVVNKKVWDTFYPSNSALRVFDTPTKKYARNYLHFEEGKNIIDGLNFSEEDWLGILTVDFKAIDNVIYHELYSLGENDILSFVSTFFNGYLFKRASFNVEYLTNDNILFRTKKDIQPRNESVLISSQTSPIVDSKNLGLQQQEFVNRIGNRQMIVTGRYENYNDIPNLKDYIDDFVLTEREIQFQNSHYIFKGIMSENYSSDNMFEGINTQRRYTSIMSPSEALISNHLTLIDLSLSNQDEGHTNWESETEIYCIENYGKKDKYIQGAIVSTDETQTIYPDNELLLETTAHAIGKSIVVTMRMNDNFNSHYKLGQEFIFLTEQQQMEYIPYVDENGRFEELKIELYRYDSNIQNRGIKFLPYEINPNPASSQNNQDYFENASYHSARLPEIPRTGTYTDIDPITAQDVSITYDVINTNARVFTTGDSNDFFVKRYKDNREITHETIQFYFGTNVVEGGSTEDIFISNKFVEYLPFVYNGTSEYRFRIAYSTSLKYNKEDKVYKGTLLSNNFVEISTNGNELSIVDVSPSTTWSQVKNGIVSYAICDVNGNILVAVNKSGSYEPLYLNKQ